MKPPLRILPHQRERADDEGIAQDRREVLFEPRAGAFGLIGLERTGEGQVETELLHHLRVAPSQEQFVLPFGQTARATAGEFTLRGRRAEVVERLHRTSRKIAEGRGGGVGDDRDEPAKAPNGQLSAFNRGAALTEVGQGRSQISGRLAVNKPHGRFNRSMEAVFARPRREFVRRRRQIGQARLLGLRARHAIPSQPIRAIPVKVALWHHVDGKSLERIHVAAFP